MNCDDALCVGWAKAHALRFIVLPGSEAPHKIAEGENGLICLLWMALQTCVGRRDMSENVQHRKRW